MRLRRRGSADEGTPLATATPASEVDQTLLLAAVYQGLIQKRELYGALLARHAAGASAAELHDEALTAARQLAIVARGVLAGGIRTTDNLLADLPEELLPFAALHAIERLCYAFAALADEDCIPEMLLSHEELAGLEEQYELVPWITAVTALTRGTAPTDGTQRDVD